MESNPVRDVLERLRTRGWVKGLSGMYQGPNCIQGALNLELLKGVLNLELPPSNVLRWGRACNLVAAIVQEQFPDRDRGRSIINFINFNDHPKTTFSDVELVLEKAAIRWDEQAGLDA